MILSLIKTLREMTMIKVKELVKYTKKLSVLYVEDEPELRTTTENILSNLFDKVDSAENGQAGLKKFQSSEFDLIITDINMPRMDGITMVKAIHEIKPEQPILITSAQDEGDKLIELMNAGADMFIAKPIIYQQFLDNLYKISKKIIETKELNNLRQFNDRQSAINDLLHNIAHHWRQPLNVLSLLNEDNFDEIESNNTNIKSLSENFTTAKKIIQTLSSTIDQFSSLLQQSEEKENIK